LSASINIVFASQGAGRVLWPVIAISVRVVVIVICCVVLSRSGSVRPEHFFWLIAAGMAVQAILVSAAIRLGAWTRGPERVESRPAWTSPRR